MHIKTFTIIGFILILLTIPTALVFAESEQNVSQSDNHNDDSDKLHAIFFNENNSEFSHLSSLFNSASEHKKNSNPFHQKHTKDRDKHDHPSKDKQQDEPDHLPNMFESVNEHGIDATYSTTGSIDLNNPFFQSLGTNDRSCTTCHIPSEGWTITPKGVQERFDETDGLDPIFRLVDGANSPQENVETVDDRRNAYSMLLNKGNIRTGIGIPDDAEFELVEVDDPYGYASKAELSMYRRPLPSTNLKFLNAIMWEGRETTLDENSGDCIFGTSNCFSAVPKDLATQANNATLGHAEGMRDLTAEEVEAIVEFESNLFTAQIYDNEAGELTTDDIAGGPGRLEEVEYYFGINDTVDGDYHTQEAFNPITMTLYDAWERYNNPDDQHRDEQAHARAAIVRGQLLFNTFPILISEVSGLNDELNMDEIEGSCTTCHNIPNAGNHSVPLPLNIGIADVSRRTPDMPLYTLKNVSTGETVQTMDPGRALVTGKWKDIGRFKGPILRAVASRAPYFHDGSASDLNEVVDFYEERFSIGLSDEEKADLVAFLKTL